MTHSFPTRRASDLDYSCMDGTVPLGKLSYVLEKTAEIVERFGLRVANVFHAGDGNMHPLILFNANDPDDAARAEEAGNEILKLCVDAGGGLTGEHGVGIEKQIGSASCRESVCQYV